MIFVFSKKNDTRKGVFCWLVFVCFKQGFYARFFAILKAKTRFIVQKRKINYFLALISSSGTASD